MGAPVLPLRVSSNPGLSHYVYLPAGVGGLLRRERGLPYWAALRQKPGGWARVLQSCAETAEGSFHCVSLRWLYLLQRRSWWLIPGGGGTVSGGPLAGLLCAFFIGTPATPRRAPMLLVCVWALEAMAHLWLFFSLSQSGWWEWLWTQDNDPEVMHGFSAVFPGLSANGSGYLCLCLLSAQEAHKPTLVGCRRGGVGCGEEGGGKGQMHLPLWQQRSELIGGRRQVWGFSSQHMADTKQLLVILEWKRLFF